MKNDTLEEKSIKEKDSKLKYKVSLIILALALVFIGVFATYAFFQTPGENNQNTSLNVKAGSMELIFSDGNNGFNQALNFGESASKTFTIKNNGTADAVAKINWKNLTNTYLDGSLTYSLTYYENEGDTPIEVITNKNVPKSEDPITIELANGLVIPVGKTYVFTLTIKLNDLPIDQTSDLSATLNTEFSIEETQNKVFNLIKAISQLQNNTVPDGIITENPNLNIPEPKPLTFDYKFISAEDVKYTTTQTNYYTYSDNFEFDQLSGSFTLVNPKVGKYSDIYSELKNKYILHPNGSNNSEMSNFQNVNIIYKVSDKTTDFQIYTYKSEIIVSESKEEYKGIYSLEDDYGISYYFRGNINNNYVKFGKWSETTPDKVIGYRNSGSLSDSKEYTNMEDCQNSEDYNKNCTLVSNAGKDMYWRIIRINGDNSVRIQYDGTSPHKNSDMNIDRIAFTSLYNLETYDNKLVGYMYSPSEKGISSSKEEAQQNDSDSIIKANLENWYELNILNENLDQYISDTIFCNDRSIPGKNITELEEDTGLGYTNNYTAYGAYGRFARRTTNWISKPDPKPTFKCIQQNDAFTQNDTEKGNGKLKYKVGLITADEIITAGAVFGYTPFTFNMNYYLFKGMHYTSLSPFYFTTNAFVSGVYPQGNYGAQNVYAQLAFAPVINLTPKTILQMKGEGTMSDPYRLSET